MSFFGRAVRAIMSRTSRIPKKTPAKRPVSRSVARRASRDQFDEVLALIDAVRRRAYAQVNTTLIQLYWNVGEYISRKTAQGGWGKGTVETLAQRIQRRFPGMTGFSSSNLWRMSQFFETYRGKRKLAPLVRELSWTHNLLILSRCKNPEERDEALDRDLKKPHENPSIGVLLCATKDSEVVEYALDSRHVPGSGC